MNPKEAETLARSMMREPLARRYVQRIESTGDNKIYSPEDVLGERLARLAAFIGFEIYSPGHILARIDPPDRRLELICNLAGIGLSALPYLWTEEVRTGLRSVNLPRHVISRRVLPTPRSWHTFETGIQMGGHLYEDGEEYVGHVADGMLLCDTAEGIEVFQFGEMTHSKTGETRPMISNALIRYGLTYPDDFPNQDWRNLAESVLTFLTFLNSPYIPKESHRIGRAARRENKRLGYQMEDDSVTFVVLRRPEPRRSHDQESNSVEWKHRWIVNGHVRAQWYPSDQSHKLIWIAPYLKGPDDAPMLEHAYKVAR